MEARLIPVDLWSRYFAWLSRLRANYSIAPRYIGGIVATIPGITPAMRATLQDLLENAIACAIKKPTRPNTPAVDDAPPGDAAATADRLRKELRAF